VVIVVVAAERPLQRRPQVVVLALQPVEPAHLIRAAQVRLGLLGEAEIIVGVLSLQRRRLPAGLQVLQGILSYRFQ
jgi:hypothetical protein